MEFLLAIFQICIVFSLLLRQSHGILGARAQLSCAVEQYTESLKLEEGTSSGFFCLLFSGFYSKAIRSAVAAAVAVAGLPKLFMVFFNLCTVGLLH